MPDRPEVDTGTAFDVVCRQAAGLIGQAGGPVQRLRLQAGDATLDIEWLPTQPAAAAGHPAAAADDSAGPGPAGAADPAAGPEDEVIIAPMVGTFYRAPEPGASPFVVEGDVVQPGQQVGILEAMKLMNPIQADRPGRVVRILVADGAEVEYGQPLLALDPAGAP